MAIKALTVSALTSGVLVLGYAVWSKWRGAAKPLATGPSPAVQAHGAPEPQPALEPTLLAEPVSGDPATQEVHSVDVDLDGLWDAADAPLDEPDVQLVDFSSELAYDEEEGAVAPEGLGVRWLTRATEAMSPFHHALSVREEAEAALLEGVSQNLQEQESAVPESSKRFKEGEFDVELPAEKRGG